MLMKKTINALFSRMEKHLEFLNDTPKGVARSARIDPFIEDTKLFVAMSADLALALDRIEDPDSVTLFADDQPITGHGFNTPLYR